MLQSAGSLFFGLALAAAFAIPSETFARDSLEKRLEDFRRNPRQLLESIPEKTRVGHRRRIPIFTKAQIASRDFIIAKNKQRTVLRGRSAIKSNDKPEDLVDDPDNLITTLEEMEKQNLTKAETPQQPWSDSYWPLFNGQIAFRYADPGFPVKSEDWKVKNDYMLGEGARVTNVDLLSPAEKYDLLVGDAGKSLMHEALSEGEQYYRASGKVEAWMGICNGWAPAAYMVERPANAVTVMAADGKTKITFNPADIKALNSLLWAMNSPQVRFIGGRCDQKHPKTDPNGRIKDQDCFDTNPGTWHQAIVNQIGVSKRSFTMDVAFDYEVWNQPLKGYSYTYFNPATLKPVKNLKDAVVDIRDVTNDKFANYRSKRSQYLVGISMNVSYVVETDPTDIKSNGPSDDELENVTYEYDLELDGNMNIIGGEWYENAHPDFLWTPGPNEKARTAADEILDSNGSARKRWDGSNPIPREWSEVAPRASESGTPVATIVEALVELSRRGQGR